MIYSALVPALVQSRVTRQSSIRKLDSAKGERKRARSAAFNPASLLLNLVLHLLRYGFIMYEHAFDAETALQQLPLHGLTTSWAKVSSILERAPKQERR